MVALLKSGTQLQNAYYGIVLFSFLFFLALRCNFCFYIFVFGYVAAIVVKLWCRLHWLTCTSVKQKLRTK